MALAILYGVGVIHYFAQNQPGQLGGPITVENALWLTYALGAWFVLPLAFWLNRNVAPVLRRLYGLFFLGFLARALIEGYLLLGPKAWIPPYGIAHDLAMIAGIALLMGLWRHDLTMLQRPVDRVLKGFLVVTMLALAAEALFAWRFYVAVEFRTDFLWYADYSPRFADLNPLMRVAVAAVHLDLALRLIRLYAPQWLATNR